MEPEISRSFMLLVQQGVIHILLFLVILIVIMR